jgi:hypothetical protein
LLVPRGAKALVSILLQGRAQAGLTGRVSLALLEVNELLLKCLPLLFKTQQVRDNCLWPISVHWRWLRGFACRYQRHSARKLFVEGHVLHR